MATVSLKNIEKRYGNVEVIHGISAEIEDGEFIVIVGPSGCGKSTLLRMVAGLETISAGEVQINGTRVNEMEPMDRDIAMVFQNYALYPHMSVRQNMAYSLKIAKVSSADIERKVSEAAQLLQLEPYLDRKPKELSGGQRQRVAMGRAIVRQPAIFLFDEPLSNLDAKLRVQMRLEIKQLQSNLGITSLYVTHDQVEAMTMADRMIVMNDGIAEQIGTPLNVYEKPQTLFTAQFIGSPAMNILSAEVKAGAIYVGDINLGIIKAPEGPISLGIRPEHVVVGGTDNLPMSVLQSEPLGANTLLHGKVNGQVFTASLAGIHKISDSKGELQLTVKPENMHLFDFETGQRID